jgi:TonB-linked SusC/RagA family outer membrane protein
VPFNKVLLFVAVLVSGFFFAPLRAQNGSLTLPQQQITFEKFTKVIEAQSKYMVVYSQTDINTASQITFSKRSLPLATALKEASSQVNCTYAVEKNYITFTSNAVSGKTIEARGTVVDAAGEPLIGVNIVVKGKTTGTVSNIDGQFSLSVASTDKLQFSYTGYKTQTVAPSENAMRIVLTVNSEVLDEVVVVGYGTQKKVNLTGAVSSIKFGEEMGSRPVTSVSASLSGLAAGLNVTQSTGKPGTEATLRVRGTGTLNNSNPLVLVDGVEWSIDNLNPNDIASISVLKDASSTAIYGALGANGVILITTKSGQGKPRVNYSGYYSMQRVVNKLDFVNDYADFMELANESATNIDQSPYYTQETIDTWRAAKQNPNGLTELGVPNYIAYPNTDWFDALFCTGHSQQHHLSVNGASDHVSYQVAAGYLDNPGIMNQWGINSGEKKVTVQSRLEVKVNNWIKVGANIYGTRLRSGVGNTSGMFEMLSRTVPGIYPGERKRYGTPASAEESTNANNLFTYLDRSGKIDNMHANVSGYLIADIIDGLQLEGRYNYQADRSDTHRWSNNYTTYDYTRQVAMYTPALSEGTINNSMTKANRVNIDLLLRYNRTFNKIHELGAIIGYSDQNYNYSDLSTSKKGMTSWDLTVANTASTPVSIAGSATAWALESYFGRVNYSLLSRYLLEVNVRRDGCSRFSPDSRWGTFPSFSLGWRLSEERFMDWSDDWLDNLKLRVSYGKIGNSRTSDYAWQALYAKKVVTLDGSSTNAIQQSKIGNNNLKWETTKTANFGLDLGVLNNRLTAEFDAYVKNTSGILYTPTIYLTMGTVSGSTENIAEVRNKGVELNVNWSDNISDFRYNVGGNFSFNKSIVTKYKGKLEKRLLSNGEYINNISEVSESGFGGRILEDHLLGETYIYKVYRGTGNYACDGSVDLNAGPRDGIIRTEKDMQWVKAMIDAGYKFSGGTTIGKNTLWYGDMVYADVDGDGNYGSTNDQVMSGHSYLPKYNFGLNLSASWKGFDFYALLSGAAGFHLLWVTTGWAQPGVNMYKFIADDHYFYDPDDPSNSKTNINAAYPRLNTRNGGSNSDYWEYKGNYLKLKNVQLGYTVPQQITRKFRVEKLRVYVSGDNLHTWTKYPGMDPELGTSITYPLVRQGAFGVQLTL